jgi:hypothetical protein
MGVGAVLLPRNVCEKRWVMPLIILHCQTKK